MQLQAAVATITRLVLYLNGLFFGVFGVASHSHSQQRRYLELRPDPGGCTLHHQRPSELTTSI
jgi:hypothetical protein